MSSVTPRAVQEVERKYEAGSAQRIPSLSGLPGVEGEPLIDSVQLSALYYDTVDLRLLQAGITLRRREGGEDAGWHLKIPAGSGARTELQLPPAVPRTDADVPAAFTDLLTGITRGLPLNAVALISTDRERRRLVNSSGVTLAEVVSDVVIAALPDGSGGPDERVWREIEVEQVAGGRKLSDAIEARLLAAGITRSASPSKLRRALGDALATPAGRLSKKAFRPRNLLREYLVDQVHALARADIDVRRETEDSVHRLRVAARRIRSVLQVYGSELGAQDSAARLVVELRWLGRSLGTARDAEVQWDRLVTQLDDIPEMPEREIVRARLDEYFSRLAADARPRALSTLDSERYLTLLTELDSFVAALDAPSGRRAPSHAAVDRTLRTLSRSVDTRVRRARGAGTRAERDELTHRARKRAKLLRYALESTAPLHPRRTARALEEFKRFQEVLGDYQDAVVSREHLLAMVEQEQHSPESSLGLGILLQRELTLGDSLAARVKPEWKTTEKITRTIWT